MTIRDKFETRPDNRAGDIKPIYPLEPELKCGLDWLVISVWAGIFTGIAAFWVAVAWLAGVI